MNVHLRKSESSIKYDAKSLSDKKHLILVTQELQTHFNRTVFDTLASHNSCVPTLGMRTSSSIICNSLIVCISHNYAVAPYIFLSHYCVVQEAD